MTSDGAERAMRLAGVLLFPVTLVRIGGLLGTLLGGPSWSRHSSPSPATGPGGRPAAPEPEGLRGARA